MSQSPRTAGLRQIPSVDRLMYDELFVGMAKRIGRDRAVQIAREAVAAVRSRSNDGLVDRDIEAEVLKTAADIWRAENASRLRRVINATGVVIHTNLGRSALAPEAVQAILENASRYTTLEYDLVEGARGRRGGYAEDLIVRLTGAESAAIVNNCAAAAFLVLRVLAAGKEVIISRGELVEIGGDFRVPDVLSESGATLREVGTTNRTKLKDYEKAVSPNTGLILRVHPSNYRVIGFTETPSLAELARLAHEHDLPLFEDAGSGALVDLADHGLTDEPVVSRSIANGADVVCFSGDKLLGGVQAGFIVGRKHLIDAVKKHPLYRALRLDKLAYAAIEATLGVYARGEHFEKIPTLQMLAATPDDMRRRVETVAAKLANAVEVEMIEGESVIGGGSAPDVKPQTWLLALSMSGRSAESIESALRSAEPPLVARIQDNRVVIDLRTVFEDEEDDLIRVIRSLGDS